MSRLGRKAIEIEEGVTIELNGQSLTLRSDRGEKKFLLPLELGCRQENNHLFLIAKSESKRAKALQGTFRALIDNTIKGLRRNFQKTLEIKGVGYRAVQENRKLVLTLGYSHPLEFNLPAGIEAKIEKNKIVIEGIDKQQVGQTAADLRRLKPPEPYKGKGIRFFNEVILRKAGKMEKAAVSGSKGGGQ